MSKSKAKTKKSQKQPEVLHVRDCEYLAGRLEQIIQLLNDGQVHMAVAKLLADVSALRAVGLRDRESWEDWACEQGWEDRRNEP